MNFKLVVYFLRLGKNATALFKCEGLTFAKYITETRQAYKRRQHLFNDQIDIGAAVLAVLRRNGVCAKKRWHHSYVPIFIDATYAERVEIVDNAQTSFLGDGI